MWRVQVLSRDTPVAPYHCPLGPLAEMGWNNFWSDPKWYFCWVKWNVPT